jgi:hypothetical protein
MPLLEEKSTYLFLLNKNLNRFVAEFHFAESSSIVYTEYPWFKFMKLKQFELTNRIVDGGVCYP